MRPDSYKASIGVCSQSSHDFPDYILQILLGSDGVAVMDISEQNEDEMLLERDFT